MRIEEPNDDKLDNRLSKHFATKEHYQKHMKQYEFPKAHIKGKEIPANACVSSHLDFIRMERRYKQLIQLENTSQQPLRQSNLSGTRRNDQLPVLPSIQKALNRKAKFKKSPAEKKLSVISK